MIPQSAGSSRIWRKNASKSILSIQQPGRMAAKLRHQLCEVLHRSGDEAGRNGGWSCSSSEAIRFTISALAAILQQQEDNDIVVHSDHEQAS